MTQLSSDYIHNAKWNWKKHYENYFYYLKKKRECFCTLDLSRQDFHIWLSRVEHEWEEILSLLLGPSEKDINQM